MKQYLLPGSSCFLVIILFLAVACSKTIETNSAFNNPDRIAIDNLYKSTISVSTIAGKLGDHGNAEDGNGGNARFWNPTKMVYDNRNNILYVADGTTIRSIDQSNNVKTFMTLGAIGNYNEILDIDIAPGSVGGILYFITKENDLYKIEPKGKSFAITKIVDRIYGGNATGILNAADHFDGPTGVATGKKGDIFFFNSFWNTMHRITLTSIAPVTGKAKIFAGKPLATRSGNSWPFQDGKGQTATFGGTVPEIACDAKGNIYVADFRNDLVRMVTPSGIVTSLFQYGNGFGIDQDGPVSTAQANRVTQVAVNGEGSSVFFTTYNTGGQSLPALRVVKPGIDVTTLVGKSSSYGDGSGATAGLGTIGGIATTADGKTIYVSEPGNKVIRKVTIQ